VFRTVVGYYSGEEDAYDMRKAMPRDVHKRSLVPTKSRIYPHELETD
jgi:N-terminal acetyltransferase B complex catalytic subunit